MSEDRILRMVKQRDLFPRKQRLLCDYLFNNIDSIMTMTANEVAEASSVGKATLYRMLHQLGYESFTDFRGDLHNYALKNIRPNYWQMQEMLKETDKKTASSLFEVIESQLQVLNIMAGSSIIENFSEVVEKIISSYAFSILGFRSSKHIAEYFESLLIPTPVNVSTLVEGENFVFDKIAKLPKNSTIFVIARWPYTSMTIRAAEYAHDKGHSIILLTNNISCAVSNFSDITLLTPKIENRYSIIPFITVIEALVEEICLRFSKETIENINVINSVLETNKIVQW